MLVGSEASKGDGQKSLKRSCHFMTLYDDIWWYMIAIAIPIYRSPEAIWARNPQKVSKRSSRASRPGVLKKCQKVPKSKGVKIGVRRHFRHFFDTLSGPGRPCWDFLGISRLGGVETPVSGDCDRKYMSFSNAWGEHTLLLIVCVFFCRDICGKRRKRFWLFPSRRRLLVTTCFSLAGKFYYFLECFLPVFCRAQQRFNSQFPCIARITAYHWGPNYYIINSKPILSCKTQLQNRSINLNNYVTKSDAHMVCFATTQDIT